MVSDATWAGSPRARAYGAGARSELADLLRSRRHRQEDPVGDGVEGSRRHVHHATAVGDDEEAEQQRREAEQYSRNLADAVLYQFSQSTTETDRKVISESVQHMTWTACTQQIVKIYYDAMQQYREMIRIGIV